MKKVFIFSLILSSAFLSMATIFAYPEHAYAIAPDVSIGSGNGNSPTNTGPVHGTVFNGSIPVYATVNDPELESYHFRVVKDGGSQGHTCLDSDALFAPENQGYASTTLNKDACGFNFNQSVYTAPIGFADMLIATLNADDLIAFGGEGDYWLIIGARDTYGNRTHEDYLQDPKIKITINKIVPPTTGTTTETTGGSGSNGGGGGVGGGDGVGGGGGSGGGSGASAGGNGPIVGSIGGGVGGGGGVLGASTAGQVLGESCGLYMNKYLRIGSSKNDSEQVRKLQTFLNKHMNSNIPVTGYFGLLTLAAVKEFQTKYTNEILAPWGISSPTGIVYLTTLPQINNLECPGIGGALPPLVPWSENPNVQ